MMEKKYPFFCTVEKIRENKDGILEVRCKLCKKWFEPTGRQLEGRILALEGTKGNGGNFMYCSSECKQNCPSYNWKPNYKDYTDKKLYGESELNIWAKEVKKRDGYTCQFCGSKENIRAHHIKPKKMFPYEALDPDNGITFCEKCHFKIGHQNECSTYNLSHIKCNLGE